MIRNASIAYLAFLALIISPSLSWADIYTYEDSDGVIHFTDYRPDKDEVKSFRVFERSGRQKIAFTIDPGQLETIIENSSAKHGLEKELVKAVIRAESDFDPNAVSKKGAIGLMQLLPKTAYSMGVDNIEDPRMNVETGCKLLKQLIEKYDGDLELSLAAYNAGETAVNRHKGVPPYKETINYVQKVIKYYNERSNTEEAEALFTDTSI